jgi:hypothetical protein
MQADVFVLTPDTPPPALQTWLASLEPARAVLMVERQDDGQVVLRALPEVDPLLLDHVRVSVAKYHEALMNLT